MGLGFGVFLLVLSSCATRFVITPISVRSARFLGTVLSERLNLCMLEAARFHPSARATLQVQRFQAGSPPAAVRKRCDNSWTHVSLRLIAEKMPLGKQSVLASVLCCVPGCFATAVLLLVPPGLLGSVCKAAAAPAQPFTVSLWQLQGAGKPVAA